MPQEPIPMTVEVPLISLARLAAEVGILAVLVWQTQATPSPAGGAPAHLVNISLDGWNLPAKPQADAVKPSATPAGYSGQLDGVYVLPATASKEERALADSPTLIAALRKLNTTWAVVNNSRALLAKEGIGPGVADGISLPAVLWYGGDATVAPATERPTEQSILAAVARIRGVTP